MKKLKFLVLDCETCTLDFVGQWKLNESESRSVATARPLVYDIGWTICDRQGNIYKERNFLVTETFSIPSVFQTAYYKEKRPLYIQALRENKISLKDWNTIAEILFNDLQEVDMCVAYNAMFDFKKAIPFTDQYIRHLYSEDFSEWYEKQKLFCKNIVNKIKVHSMPSNFDGNNFLFRGQNFPLCDLWSETVSKLLNTDKFKNFCLDNNFLSASGRFFTTSAEVAFRYLMKEYDFIEDHTALSDARIETKILGKCTTRGKMQQGIKQFPFRQLDETYQFITERTKKERSYTVLRRLEEADKKIIGETVEKKKSERRIKKVREILGIVGE